MKVIKFIVFFSIIINYSSILIDVVRGRYKGKISLLGRDLILSYGLAPLVSISIIFSFYKKIKYFN